MGFSRTGVREAKMEKKGLNPVWRGVGCITLIIMVIGSYFLAGLLVNWLNDAEWMANKIPNDPILFGEYTFPRPVTEFPLPEYGPFTLDPPLTRLEPVAFFPVQAGLSLFVAIIGYSMMVVIYSVANPLKKGKYDADPIRRKIDPGKVR